MLSDLSNSIIFDDIEWRSTSCAYAGFLLQFIAQSHNSDGQDFTDTINKHCFFQNGTFIVELEDIGLYVS